MTTEEKNEIIAAVVQSIRDASMTIAQLTPVTSVGDYDSFEVSSGRRVTYATLRTLISNALSAAMALSAPEVTASGGNVVVRLGQGGSLTRSATLPGATAEAAGVMTASDKVKLTELDGQRIAGLEATPHVTNVELVVNLTGGGTRTVRLPLADIENEAEWTAGLISGSDLNKALKSYDWSDATRHYVGFASGLSGAVAPLHIATVVENVTTEVDSEGNAAETTRKSDSALCSVVYDKGTNKMLLRWKPMAQLGQPERTYYYEKWDSGNGYADMLEFAEADGTPRSYVVYETSMDGAYDMALPYIYQSNASTPGLFTARVYSWLLRMQKQIDALVTSLSSNSATRAAANAMVGALVPDQIVVTPDDTETDTETEEEGGEG